MLGKELAEISFRPGYSCALRLVFCVLTQVSKTENGSQCKLDCEILAGIGALLLGEEKSNSLGAKPKSSCSLAFGY